MFNLGFLSNGLGSLSGSGLGDLGHLGLGELGYLAAMTAAERRNAAALAKQKRQELAAAVAEARRTGGAKAAAAVRHAANQARQADAKHAAAAKKEAHVADVAAKKKAALAKKEERRQHRIGGKNVSLKAGEEKAAKNMESAVNGLKSAVAKCNALAKSAKMSRNKAARQAAMDCIKNTMATFSGGPTGMQGYSAPGHVLHNQRHAAHYAMHPNGMRGFLGMGDDVTDAIDNAPVDPGYGTGYGAGPASNIDNQGGAPMGMPGAGMDPMQMMMMQQMMKPPDLPKQCQKNMNKPICQFYTLSQQSQQQMQFMMMIFMQLISQLQSMLQDLSAQGPMAAGAYPPMGVDPNAGYPAPTGAYPSFDTSGAGMMPPDGSGMYAPPPMSMAPSGGAYSPGGVDQIPAGFDSGGDVPGAGGGDSFIPQDIAINAGGYFTPPQAPASTYAPGGDTYIQQEYNVPAEVIEMPAAPDAGNIPSTFFSDEAIVPEGGDTVPRFQQAQLQLPGPGPQELVEIAAGGAMPGPSQGDIQNQYFETEQGGDGF